jgi:hypothetical protein
VILGTFYFADWLIKYSRNPRPHIKFMALAAAVAFIGALPTTGIVPEGVQDLLHTSSPWWSATFLSVTSILIFIVDYTLFHFRKIYYPRNGLFIVGTILSIFFIGKAVAHDQIASSHCYQIVTTNDTISDVRLVRTSTMGYIIAVNGTIVFLPAGEVRKIKAEAPRCPKGP